MMTKASNILWLLLVFVGMLGLSACGSGKDSSEPSPAEQILTPYILTDNETNKFVKEVHKKLSDGRTVTCLLFDGYKAGGLDCDFANAE